jgi:hypothetical protein
MVQGGAHPESDRPRPAQQGAGRRGGCSAHGAPSLGDGDSRRSGHQVEIDDRAAAEINRTFLKGRCEDYFPVSNALPWLKKGYRNVTTRTHAHPSISANDIGQASCALIARNLRKLRLLQVLNLRSTIPLRHPPFPRP